MRVNQLTPVMGAALLFTCFGSINSQNQDDAQEQCICVPYYYCSTNPIISNNTIDPSGDSGGDMIENTNGEGLIDIRFGEGGCQHYLDKCCNIPGGLPTGPPPTQRPAPKEHSCGNRHFNGVDFRITGNSDNEADYGEFPWMVAILKQLRVGSVSDGKDVAVKMLQCGGSIIHNQVILTAAHCVKRSKNLIVRAGEWDTQTDKERFPIQERNVKQIIIHENFYAGGLYNDIALLVLDSPLEPSEVVSPICLPDQDEIMDNRNCVVTGWGKDVFGKEGKYQVILKKVEVPVVPRDLCQKALQKTRLGEDFKLHESFSCAGGEVGKDSCKGDGGGPLACPVKDNPKLYVQAGIVAWGIGCGDPIPAAYANVPHFRGWINEKLASLGFS